MVVVIVMMVVVWWWWLCGGDGEWDIHVVEMMVRRGVGGRLTWMDIDSSRMAGKSRWNCK